MINIVLKKIILIIKSNTFKKWINTLMNVYKLIVNVENYLKLKIQNN